jgi:hypothetical protein
LNSGEEGTIMVTTLQLKTANVNNEGWQQSNTDNTSI